MSSSDAMNTGMDAHTDAPLRSPLAPPVPMLPLRLRARAATSQEMAAIPWLKALEPELRERVASSIQVAEVEVGERVCRIGREANYWFGVIDGLLKMSNDDAAARPVTFTGVPPGGWFGEGTLLKREVYRYNIQALRRSVVAGLPLESFHELLESSLAFNRYVLNQLNERLGQFIAAREIDRQSDPDLRVARNLAALFHPLLYPGVGGLLRITQQELGHLVGLSRQRVNEALRHLQEQRLIAVDSSAPGFLLVSLVRVYRCHHEDRGEVSDSNGGGPTRGFFVIEAIKHQDALDGEDAAEEADELEEPALEAR
ncbi:cyclic nucleotide-binding domain-containing protein [Ditylenchus destructor]|nr:cyclic nucleotide-binding domain-containing protein [Ditylenchus destructor]